MTRGKPALLRDCRTVAAIVWLSALASGPGANAEEGAPIFYSVQIDQLEHRWEDDADRLRWDLEGWVGGDTNRLWFRSEGDERTSGASGGDLELQLLYSRHVLPYWDFQIGVRQDVVFSAGPNKERTLAMIGFDGLAPYWFELEPALFISDDGDISARVTTTWDLFVTQRLIAQPRFEINAAASDATDFGIKSGVNDIELGLRLRYELVREFAPYVGVSWTRKLGRTADLARDEGDEPSNLSFVVGVRMWF